MSTIYADLFADVSWHKPNVTFVRDNAYRLDAAFFSQNAELARMALGSSGLPVHPMRDLAKVFALSDFSLGRIPAAEDRGVAFFTFSDILEWDAQPTMFLSRKYEPNLDDYIVKEGWVLLSRAGTVGNAIIVGPELSGKAIANHAIRIVPKDNDIGRLLYLVLTGSIGRTVISSFMYGAVVDVIKPAQVEQLEIPFPSTPVLKRLSALIGKSIAAKGVSVSLLRNACILVQKVNSLPLLSKEYITTGNEMPQPTSFEIISKRIVENSVQDSEYRLDAHFYNPTAQLAVTNIKKCCGEVKTVGDVARVLFAGGRLKRNYVESTHGVPFLSGKNIVQIRPTDLKYVSNLSTLELQDLIVKKDWILITRTGTIGRTCYIWKNYENYTASDNILRVVPDHNKIDSGYLYAFLSSGYGYKQILRYRCGSVVDLITNTQIEKVLIPIPSRKDQLAIGEMVREAYEKRAEAIRLEDEAQAILMNELTKAQGAKGV
jgi:type I restriction enzyme S subunit